VVAVTLSVALGAQRNQVLFGIVAGLAAELNMVYFQPVHTTAHLAPPSVPPQHLDMQLTVFL
jgi:hypothetical protein